MVGLEILDGLSNDLQCSLKWSFKGLFTWRCQPQVGKVTHLGGETCLSMPDHMHMIGGETHRGGLCGLPDQITLLARVKFGHVKVSRLVNLPSLDTCHIKFVDCTTNCLWSRICIIKSDNTKAPH